MSNIAAGVAAGGVNFRKYPTIKIEGKVVKGWDDIWNKILNDESAARIVAVDCYVGVDVDEIIKSAEGRMKVVDTRALFRTPKEVEDMTAADVTDDAIFGYITRLNLVDFFDPEKLSYAVERIGNCKNVVVIGPGAFLAAPAATTRVYADMARWEIQLRMKKKQVSGLGVENRHEDFNLQYKRGFFVDWRVCDKHKKAFFEKSDYLLDTTQPGEPKLADMATMKNGLKQAARQPFSFKPYFDPGPWGGHWLEEVCDLPTDDVPNYAWCMNCVAEENSLLFDIEGEIIEIPGIDLVFFETTSLLGEAVEGRFGKEFPIRFDFLDTMDGGNLSLQVHPDITYIQEKFGMHYTQDESYYLLDAKEDASVYLGFKENVDVDEMFDKLKQANVNGGDFDADAYVNKFPARKHDHFLIPSGTIHCSGKNSLVLEISATPFIFTFKLWDWGRLGLDGKPRPINIEHGYQVINRERDTAYAKKELINVFEKVGEGPGWTEERTGLHRREFIETRRHWFTGKVEHDCHGSVNVLMLVEGEQAVIESPSNQFAPFVINYAETIVIPASVEKYTISPYGKSEGKKLATIKAFVRTKA